MMCWQPSEILVQYIYIFNVRGDERKSCFIMKENTVHNQSIKNRIEVNKSIKE